MAVIFCGDIGAGLAKAAPRRESWATRIERRRRRLRMGDVRQPGASQPDAGAPHREYPTSPHPVALPEASVTLISLK